LLANGVGERHRQKSGLLAVGTAATRDAEDTLTDGSNLPDGAAVKAYGDANWANYWTKTGSDIYYGAGNVGIGTTSPSHALYVDVGDDIYVNNAETGTGELRLGAAWGYPGIYGESETKPLVLGSATGNIYMNSNVGIGTSAPGNPLAVNRSSDGVIVDFESEDIVEGNVSISGNTTSYNAFVGSHYTQLKDGQEELPVGAVVVSTGEIIPCQAAKNKLTEVLEIDAITVVSKKDAIVLVDVTVEDRSNIITEIITYTYDPETDTETEHKKFKYGTKIIKKKQYAEGVKWDQFKRRFYKLKPGYIEKDGQFFQESIEIKSYTDKEYFVYVDTTIKSSDKAVYGVWLGKMSDNAIGMSFGNDAKPVYLVAQVGLFKVRVTDTNGNISNGDYLETSVRPMEAQKQSSGAKLNSTIAKAMVDVDWSKVAVDAKFGYKWKLIPCTF
jgi:hypothetical protein